MNRFCLVETWPRLTNEHGAPFEKVEVYSSACEREAQITSLLAKEKISRIYRKECKDGRQLTVFVTHK